VKPVGFASFTVGRSDSVLLDFAVVFRLWVDVNVHMGWWSRLRRLESPFLMYDSLFSFFLFFLKSYHVFTDFASSWLLCGCVWTLCRRQRSRWVGGQDLASTAKTCGLEGPFLMYDSHYLFIFPFFPDMYLQNCRFCPEFYRISLSQTSKHRISMGWSCGPA
jgi:hypothetical protein